MIQALSGTGAMLCLFLLALMGAKAKRVIGDRWLMLWLTLHLAYFTAFGLAQSAQGPALLALSLAAQMLIMLVAPAQYLHVQTSTLGETRPALIRAGVALAFALAFPVLILAIGPSLQQGALVVEAGTRWIGLLPVAAILATLYYPLASLVRLRRYRRLIKQRLSNLETAGLNWIRIWVITTVVMLGVQLAVFLISLTLRLPLPLHIAALLTAQGLQIAWAGFHGLTTSGVFRVDPALLDTAAVVDAGDIAASRGDFRALQSFIAAHDPQLDSELTTTALASQIGWAPERLGRAIRHGGQTSFHDLINRARIDSLSALVRDPRNQRISLIALALDAGFGSKSALYSAFQNLEGQSPAQWRRRNINP